MKSKRRKVWVDKWDDVSTKKQRGYAPFVERLPGDVVLSREEVEAVWCMLEQVGQREEDEEDTQGKPLLRRRSSEGARAVRELHLREVRQHDDSGEAMSPEALARLRAECDGKWERGIVNADDLRALLDAYDAARAALEGLVAAVPSECERVDDGLGAMCDNARAVLAKEGRR